MKKIISVLLVVLFFSSCSEYQNALKNEDVAVKFDVGTKLYDAGNIQKQFVFLNNWHHHIEENLKEKSCFICILNLV